MEMTIENLYEENFQQMTHTPRILLHFLHKEDILRGLGRDGENSGSEGSAFREGKKDGKIKIELLIREGTMTMKEFYMI